MGQTPGSSEPSSLNSAGLAVRTEADAPLLKLNAARNTVLRAVPLCRVGLVETS
jgi:hypothetical protein